MAYDLRKKVAIVTGGSRGIGRAIAERLARDGAAVIVNYLANEQAANEVVKAITGAGGKAQAIRADVSKVSEIVRLFDEAEAAFGQLDIVMANAGTALVAQELGPRNITVNALLPGYTDTDLMPERDRKVAAGASPFKRVGQPTDVADAAAFLASYDARRVTGQELGAGGGVF
jgi:NAD(P)-dependent dehydrogenase (short-subunit alcohol dehydrogenase family)